MTAARSTPQTRYRELHRRLQAQALERVDVALRVAVLTRAGVPRQEIAEQLGVGAREIREAVADLKAIAPRSSADDRNGRAASLRINRLETPASPGSEASVALGGCPVLVRGGSGTHARAAASSRGRAMSSSRRPPRGASCGRSMTT